MARILEALRQHDFNCIAPGVSDDLSTPEAKESEPPAYRPFETPPPETDQVFVEDIPPETPLLFRYFLDGSMRTTNAGYIIDPKHRSLPLFAAQVAVAITRLDGLQLQVDTYKHQTILLFPDTFGDRDTQEARQIITNAASTSRMPVSLSVECYQYSEAEEPIASARQKTLSTMHSMEIEQVNNLAKSQKLSRESLLMIDGSLQFYENLTQYREAFQNVVGVAKSFDLHQQISQGRKAKQVGLIVSALRHRHRTPAREVKHRNISIASWYLRLHPAHRLVNLSDGVVKLELFPQNTGGTTVRLQSARCRRLSQDVLALRHPATPSTDTRWASHLYPIYVTERYLQLRFRSNSVIRALL